MGVTVKAFGSREEALIREIARYGCSQSSTWKTIDIWFKPLEPSYEDSEEYCEGSIDDPWYRMQRLEKEIEKRGVTLRWQAPPWTNKEEWLRLIKKESRDIDEWLTQDCTSALWTIRKKKSDIIYLLWMPVKERCIHALVMYH